MSTVENDIVLIYMAGEPLSFARIESIQPDIKPDWYHVSLLMLQIPPHVVSWILRDAYINGEVFTMSGKEMRLERVVCPIEPGMPEQDDPGEKGPAPLEKKPAGEAEIISFSDRKKGSS